MFIINDRSRKGNDKPCASFYSEHDLARRNHRQPPHHTKQPKQPKHLFAREYLAPHPECLICMEHFRSSRLYVFFLFFLYLLWRDLRARWCRRSQQSLSRFSHRQPKTNHRSPRAAESSGTGETKNE